MRLSRRAPRVLLALAALVWVALPGNRCLAAQGEITGTSNVYLRNGPGADYKVVGTLNAGDKVVLLGSEGVWTKVATLDGRVGYLNRRFVTASPESEGGPSPTPKAAGPGEAEKASAAPAVAAEATKPEVADEMADLRSQIGELKHKIDEQRSADTTGGRPTPNGAMPPQARPSAVVEPGADTGPAREQGVGVLAVAILCLIIGWVLGSTFTRRRNRSQRSRLRF